MRFVEDMTQSQIADQIGISQMHVSRLIRKALETVRTETLGLAPISAFRTDIPGGDPGQQHEDGGDDADDCRQAERYAERVDKSCYQHGYY